MSSLPVFFAIPLLLLLVTPSESATHADAATKHRGTIHLSDRCIPLLIQQQQPPAYTGHPYPAHPGGIQQPTSSSVRLVALLLLLLLFY